MKNYFLRDYELEDAELLNILMNDSSAIAVNIGGTRLMLMQADTLVVMLQEAWQHGRETSDPSPFTEE